MDTLAAKIPVVVPGSTPMIAVTPRAPASARCRTTRGAQCDRCWRAAQVTAARAGIYFGQSALRYVLLLAPPVSTCDTRGDRHAAELVVVHYLADGLDDVLFHIGRNVENHLIVHRQDHVLTEPRRVELEQFHLQDLSRASLDEVVQQRVLASVVSHVPAVRERRAHVGDALSCAPLARHPVHFGLQAAHPRVESIEAREEALSLLERDACGECELRGTRAVRLRVA